MAAGPNCRCERPLMTHDVLKELGATIKARRAASAESSYTKQLLEGGPERCAKKFGEEAVETVMAAVGRDDDGLKNEAADLLFHLLVLLEVRGIAFDDVLEVLARRAGTSGHTEKAARTK